MTAPSSARPRLRPGPGSPDRRRGPVVAQLGRLALVLLTAMMASPGGGHAQTTAPPVTITVRALADTVVSHQSAWVEIWIINDGGRAIEIPYRRSRVVGEWRFEGPGGQVLLDWPKKKEMDGAQRLKLAAGDTLYDVISVESSFGMLTEPGEVRGWCRVAGALSPPVALARRPARDGDPPSSLREAGPLLGVRAHETIQVKLWGLCAGGGNYLDCDEALFTVAWDRLQTAPEEARAVVDTLLVQYPRSGWCRSAVFELVDHLPKSEAERWLTEARARGLKGVAARVLQEADRRRRPGGAGRRR